ncbi:MAG: cation diffusion facilitator family transporter [Gammaproteobacteria bacterium]|nr:cation diffusion facilitator family transporter [Gammaproteobacteria bacterium]
MSHSSPTATPNDRYAQVKRVTIVGAVINVLLGFGKIVLGFVGQSQALVADGVHSLADLISDMVVLYAAKHGQREADEDHPYGHGRIETVITIFLGVFLIAVAAGITYDTVSRLMEPERLLVPSAYALVAAIISILAKEFLYQYTHRVAVKIHSNLLKANAWHHRTDAISSVVALIGIAGSMMGFAYFDAVAAIGVSVLIAKVGWDIVWNNLKELIDTAIEPEKIEEIRGAIMSVNGVKAVHSLRTRSHGGQSFVDVHILVNDPKMSVSEGHHISENVLNRLTHKIGHVGDVTVHIDPEDDEQAMVSTHLPMRDQLVSKLRQNWTDIPESQQIRKITLHYLDGKVRVEILLPLDCIKSPTDGARLKEIFNQAGRKDPDVAEIITMFV